MDKDPARMTPLSDDLHVRHHEDADPYDPTQHPWGWHGQFPRGTLLGALLTIAFFLGLAFNRDNEISHISTAYLVGLVLIIAGGTAHWIRVQQRKRRFDHRPRTTGRPRR